MGQKTPKRFFLSGSLKFMICCEALKTKSSAVYSAILNEMFTLFGPPEVLLGDREFDCADVYLLCLKWGEARRGWLAKGRF